MTASAIGSYATTALVKQLIGTTDSADDTLIGLLCDRGNSVLEGMMGQVVAPIASATYLYDGDGLSHLYLPTPVNSSPGIGGLRAVTLVETATYTGGTYGTVTATDYALRGRAPNGGPYRYLVFSDRPTGTYRSWYSGRETVRVTGTAGWSAIPDDLTQLALALVQRAWNARQTGYQNVEGVDENGRPIIARFLALPDYLTLKRYTVKQPQVFG